jgi:hypothetical protein
MRIQELERVWKLLDGCCDALERLGLDEQGRELLEKHENRIDFSAIVGLKNDVEELMKSKRRNKR